MVTLIKSSDILIYVHDFFCHFWCDVNALLKAVHRLGSLSFGQLLKAFQSKIFSSSNSIIKVSHAHEHIPFHLLSSLCLFSRFARQMAAVEY